MSSLLDQVLRMNLYVQPVLFILVVTINLLNIYILCSRALRSSPCAHYFIAYAVFSIIYISMACPTQFLRGHHFDWAAHPIGCKLHFYLVFLAPVLAKIMLLLASFDRYCSSSKSRLLHLKSTIQAARRTIVIGTLLAAIYMSPMLVIYHWDSMSRKCVLRSETLVHLYSLSQIIFYYLLSPTLMAVFGVMTIVNIRQQSIRARPYFPSLRRRRTEGQLARMLLLQVSIHLILMIPFGVIYAINAFDPSTRTPNITAIRYILLLLQQCDFFLTFFLYVVSATVYRRELIRIFTTIQWRHWPLSRESSKCYRRVTTTEIRSGNVLV